MHGVGTTAEAAALPMARHPPPAAATAATESYLQRDEESALKAQAVQVTRKGRLLNFPCATWDGRQFWSPPRQSARCTSVANRPEPSSPALPIHPACPNSPFQADTRQQLERATASPAVQSAAKETLRRESESLGRTQDSAARQGRWAAVAG